MTAAYLHVSVVWNSGIFVAMGARIIRHMHDELQRLLGNARVSDYDYPIILVGFALSQFQTPLFRYLG
jgi:hypothetical protein